jgi:hypothetical protein
MVHAGDDRNHCTSALGERLVDGIAAWPGSKSNEYNGIILNAAACDLALAVFPNWNFA